MKASKWCGNRYLSTPTYYSSTLKALSKHMNCREIWMRPIGLATAVYQVNCFLPCPQVVGFKRLQLPSSSKFTIDIPG